MAFENQWETRSAPEEAVVNRSVALLRGAWTNNWSHLLPKGEASTAELSASFNFQGLPVGVGLGK